MKFSLGWISKFKSIYFRSLLRKRIKEYQKLKMDFAKM
ncbi:hypothetical protein LEP1GSC079_3376 [Leptospira interrogans str. FPW1039]|uniref:Uncharacterized protein n=1 Tax=Leptospira interrogans str. FPW1039 TaxID=1193040 RepID=A0A0F6ID72_LEPIR|nr:hypothetical protein LEP1GSC007_2853 [Leptospira interrogans serovar Bulgarica str. Mallika]EKN95862.1 hypothetical protein LEP1GSC014_1803 [Leptospira interrogans serovar Pomona str. Pomona]EMJ35997.1 hypothetical protein LEP1GSC079_3376 [Leptospira interrogans str. FPW1039]EMJ54098.1 hypothetical protein LEP1GSC013_1384 [Leptospira interrogans serovar Valbuzzi str. Duyster]EMN99890.1 hypothetical protein LEP1GSC112_1155 [Leptospira interrogans serovar Pomona str. UT364]EMO94276.1 hypothet